MKKLLHWEGNLKKVAKDIPVSTWTFWYHKPYRCDWRAGKKIRRRDGFHADNDEVKI